MNRLDVPYLVLLEEIMSQGCDRGDRTGTGTRSVFGRQCRYSLRDGYIPVLTTKRVFWRGVVEELLWMLAGDTNVKRLQDRGVHIWNDWPDENGDLGPVYGAQWRSWPDHTKIGPSGDLDSVDHIDQIANVIDSLKNNPESRRHLVTAWNPADIDDMALPPCHCLFQFYCEPLTDAEREFLGHDRGYVMEQFSPDECNIPHYRLSCQLYQRSGDMFLGVPFNIASYSLLTHMLARECNMVPGDFVHTLGDAHVYHNHFDQAWKQLSRSPRESPRVELNPQCKSIWNFKGADDCKLVGYDPDSAIKAPVAV